MEQNPGETRLQYLARVLIQYMNEYASGEDVIFYDGSECDGFCIADDIAIECGLEEE